MFNIFFSKKAVILLLLASISIFGQQPSRSFFIETNILPDDKEYICYVSYKIPYKNLVFVKGSSGYETGMSFTVEVLDDESLILRESASESFFVVEYAKTESESEFLEGIVSLRLKGGEYSFNPIVNLKNTNRTIKLKPYDLNIGEHSGNIALKPIVLSNDVFNCDAKESFRIANYQNAIPYSNKEHFLIIPVIDLEVQTINVKLSQDEKTISEEDIESIGSTGVGFNKCDENITLQSIASGQKLNLFILKNFSKRLNEGKAEITIKVNDEEYIYNMEVEWVDKPKSLSRPELAIEILQNIIDKEKVREILSADEDVYYDKLREFWSKRDPIKETSFNEIMHEFYSRADFAIANYSTLDRKNGALSDRGRIYIKFGAPDNVVRKYSDNNGVVETWRYNKSQREFKFIDNSGLGNFTLL